MKTFTIKIFASALLSFTFMHVSAQKMGITFSPLNAAYYVNTSLMTQGSMGIGLERNVGDYISLKLEVSQGFQILYKISDGDFLELGQGIEEEKTWYDTTNGSSNTFAYHWAVPSFYFNYQSKFFFRGNDKTGAYMSMGIGVRSVKYILHLGYLSSYYDDENIPPDLRGKDGYEETLTVIPLVLRIGARGVMDGFFPDFSFGMGYNFSNDKTIKDKKITQTWDLSVPKLSGLTITGSIAFGIGW